MHESGAHGHSMGFNYNGKLRSAEVLIKSTDTELKCSQNDNKNEKFANVDFALEKYTEVIRRSENYDDLFATIKGFETENLVTSGNVNNFIEGEKKMVESCCGENAVCNSAVAGM